MAFIKFKSGIRQLLNNETAIAVWRVLHGYADPQTEEQQRFVGSVDEVIISWQNAPDDYIKHNFNAVAAKMIEQWTVDIFGHPSRPNYGHDLQAAQKWGLWAGGKQTALAKEIISHMKKPRQRRIEQTTLV